MTNKESISRIDKQTRSTFVVDTHKRMMSGALRRYLTYSIGDLPLMAFGSIIPAGRYKPVSISLSLSLSPSSTLEYK